MADPKARRGAALVTFIMFVFPACVDNGAAPVAEQGQGDGSIVGHLMGVGGPYGAERTPYEGDVSIEGSELTTAAGSDGAFEFDSVPPGTYRLRGQSESFDRGDGVCFSASAVEVQSGQTTEVDVLCQRK